MKIRILAFGVVKEFMNSSSLEMDVQEAITVAALKAEFEALYPEIKKLKTYLVAVNDTYAGDDETVDANAEVAIIPPVSGG
ncbi:MoaD/ThiS family protein [Niabella pedocola]|uniref:Molybdopterin synthase sulfur carrier subunit n=1 Tax=Niabella pedocola TaxID=1752077 RepID=A0ABS8PKZ2_9BACT|nr:MoaD/ThiS family protein [Niabella pedocola]MCD2421414.1 MoaD/ThiS family protein [Niabella pedocola]